MIYKDFQDTCISQLAMGTMRLPKTTDAEADIDVEQSREMLALALERGVNYIDTAWGYHDERSESVMGELLAAYPRESYHLATKFPGYDPSNWGKVAEIFERQLEKCRTDHFDFYLFHNVCEMNIDAYLDDAKYGIYSYLMEQRRAGRVRHLGFSVHGDRGVFDRFLDAYGADMEFCQIQLNWLDWEFQDASYKVERLNELGIPIWVMEPLRGGKLANVPADVMAPLEKLRPGVSAAEWSMRFLQTVPGVTTILSGASSTEQMRDNLRIFETEEPLSDDEMGALLAAARKLTDSSVPCTACNYCRSHCPQGLDISKLIALYHQRVLTGAGDFIASMALMGMPDDKKPGACIGCRSCEEVCPQKIAIADVMSDFAEMMGQKQKRGKDTKTSKIVQTAGHDQLGKFAPAFAHFNDDVLFGENWNNGDIDLKTRSIITVVALMAQGLTDSSLVYHLQNAKVHGVTRAEIAAVVTHVAFYAGWPKAWAVFNMAKDVWPVDAEDDVDAAKAAHSANMPFPIGEPNDAYAQYFVGQSFLAPVSTDQVGVFNVTFEPGCRNNWHIHHADEGGGQVLVCVAGRGFYQAWGEKPIEMLPGDCVNIPAGVKHWHGAAPDSWFSHLAIEVPGVNGSNEWLEPVDDVQYSGCGLEREAHPEEVCRLQGPRHGRVPDR